MKKKSAEFAGEAGLLAWICGLVLLSSLSGCGRSAPAGAAQNTVVMVVPAEIFPTYAGEVQGTVLSANPSCRILMVSLPAGRSMVERAFELDQLARAYPPETVFLVFGNAVPGREGLAVALKTKAGRIFVGPDSGVLTRIMEREEIEAFCHVAASKTLLREGLNSMFPERDVYAPVAAEAVRGVPLASFGAAGAGPVRVPIPRATGSSAALNGEVLFINWTGRVVTSFRVESFGKVRAGDLIRLNAGGKPFTVPYLLNENEAPPGRPFGVCNADGFFEIAVLDANAAQVLKLVPGQKISIR